MAWAVLSVRGGSENSSGIRPKAQVQLLQRPLLLGEAGSGRGGRETRGWPRVGGSGPANPRPPEAFAPGTQSHSKGHLCPKASQVCFIYTSPLKQPFLSPPALAFTSVKLLSQRWRGGVGLAVVRDLGVQLALKQNFNLSFSFLFFPGPPTP